MSADYVDEKATVRFTLALTVLVWWPFYAWQGYLGAIVWRWFAVELFGATPLIRGVML